MPDPPEDRSATAPGGDGSSVRRESTRQSYAGADAGLKGHVEEQPFGKDSSNGSEQETSKPGAVPTQQQQQPKEPAKKDSKLKQMWEKAGLDATTLQMMLKGSIPPIVALAMYQSNAVSSEYSTLGYLVAITSILGFCIMPRGKFIQTMSLNVVAICLAAAINLFALYTITQARIHTTPPPVPGAPQPTSVPYNSSASAVCAIWLLVQTYFVNTLKVARPQYNFPCILYSIFLIVSSTYGVMFPNMSFAISFMERLLEAFMTGFALATATHFFIFPMSSRRVVFKMMAGYIQLLNGMIKTQTAYMASLEEVDPVKLRKQHEHENVETGKEKKKKEPTPLYANPVSLKLKELLTKLYELHNKLHGDILPAKREVAIGKLESHDITRLWELLRLVFIPVMGLCSMMTIFERQAEKRGWGRDDLEGEEEETRQHQLDNVHHMMRALHDPFQQMSANLDGAFNHILSTLEFAKPPKAKQSDVESKAGQDTAAPGTSGFAEAYKKRLDKFHDSKEQTLKEWCSEHGIELPDDYFESSFVKSGNLSLTNEHSRERNQRSLFFTLYLEYLLWRVGRSVLDLVIYVDKRKQDGAFESSKVIFPGSKTFYNWLRAIVGREDTSQEDFHASDMDSGISQSVYLGKEFEKRRDPEHLPPRNAVERGGDWIREIPKFFRSDASVFGFRTAAATMSLGILCYLEQTQTFFLRNRLLWALIMVTLSMTRTAGQSIFTFTLRVGGTAVAMVGSYVIWYITNGSTAGALVFLWLWVFCAFYVVIKMPKLVIVAILSLVTCVLTVGYELQVKKIGKQASESNGQPAYPMYILAPYRLAAVTAGILVAFVWTIFPFPISESSELRKDLGASMYLMGLYYHLAHETIKSTIADNAGDASVKGTHGNHLNAARTTVFSKLIFLLNALGTNSSFSKFQIPIGGKFPQEEYEKLIACLRRLLLWTSLINYTAVSFDHGDAGPERSQWSTDFRKVLASVNVTSHRITTVFAVLSSSMRNAAPLPPHLELPEPFSFVKRLESLDSDILSVRHMNEPEYSAFAVLQIVSQNVTTDMTELASIVRTLVGEIDFSFKAIQSSSMESDELLGSTIDSMDEKKQP